MLKNLIIKNRLFAIVGVAVLGQILVCWLVLSGLKQSIYGCWLDVGVKLVCLVKPMIDVVTAMQDIGLGDVDLTVKLSYDGKGELVALATVFTLFVGKSAS